MKRVKNITLDDRELIQRATRTVLGNHTKRRQLWRKLSEGNKTVRQNIQEHAGAMAQELGRPVTYEEAKRELFKPIPGREEREQLTRIIAANEDLTTEQNIDNFITWVQMQIRNKSWIPDKYRQFYINDGVTRKRRLISATAIISQIFHWILILGIEPVVTRGMVAHTCASIPGRGPHYGKKFVEKWLQSDSNETKYCAKIDISKFYQSINQEAAKAEFRRVIKDDTALWLIDTIIESYPVGLPIGTYTSQWFANFILQRLDHFIKEELKAPCAMRYMDDITIFGPNKKKLHSDLQRIEEFLKPYGLQLKGNWQVFRVDHKKTETGIVLTKRKRTDDTEPETAALLQELKRARIKHKVTRRKKHKDTKRRKKQNAPDQYKETFIAISKEELEEKRDYIENAAMKYKSAFKRVEVGTFTRHYGRDVDFMGFRFYCDHTEIRRRNSLRIRRKYIKAAKEKENGGITPKTAAACLSYLGAPKHTNSYNFAHKYMYEVVSISELKGVVRNAAKNSREAGQGKN